MEGFRIAIVFRDYHTICYNATLIINGKERVLNGGSK